MTFNITRMPAKKKSTTRRIGRPCGGGKHAQGTKKKKKK